jgi:glycyl-tRNA synthetase beta chain
VTARLRDALFFWETDRRAKLEGHRDRLSTLLFHKRLGTYKEKAERIERLANWIIRVAFQRPDLGDQAAQAARLAKADLTTDMVREFTELQGTMGGIYAREEGHREEVWKAIYFHYLPVGVEIDARPTRDQLGRAGTTWAAVSLADKLDTVVGLFMAGERPTGSRDPFGLRRAAQGIVKILSDLPQTCELSVSPSLGTLVARAEEGFDGQSLSAPEGWKQQLGSFFAERMRHLLVSRGSTYDEVNATVGLDRNLDELEPLSTRLRTEAVAEARKSDEFEALAELFKRVNKISKGVQFTSGWPALVDYANQVSGEAAEKELIQRVVEQASSVPKAKATGDFAGALSAIASLKPPVARYFDEVLVMADEAEIREKRLQLMAGLRDLVMGIADISEIEPREHAAT